MNDRTIRLATKEDIEAILLVIADAKRFMASQGSGQWQDHNPSRARILADIDLAAYYVIILDQRIVGGFALLDYETDYEEMLEGAWLQQGPYLVIHRFAVHSSSRGQGLAGFAIDAIETIAKDRGVPAIRVDTHEKNKPMVSLLKKHGYLHVGAVLLGDFKRRQAFEKILS